MAHCDVDPSRFFRATNVLVHGYAKVDASSCASP
jgi:hypothetical protein